MMYYGFKDICEDFLQHHGTSKHYIVPNRINGSSIESLFSRFKCNANGNLSAVNKESAMARLLTTTQLSMENKEDEYRNTARGHLQKLK